MLLYLCVLIPLVGTVLGAAAVFFIRSADSVQLKAVFSGLAAGIMTASSFFGLLIPSMAGSATVFLPLLGLCAGFGFFILVEWGAERLFQKQSAHISVFAITLHNLPEGMAVGIALAGVLLSQTGLTVSSLLSLSAGIAIQNIPEGAIVSLPIRGRGKGRGYAFGMGVLSGVVEPIGAMAALLLSELAAVMMPLFLSFAAGAMLSVVMGELAMDFVGEERGFWGRIAFAAGLVGMTALDVLFG
ncbi:MAG: ZIP family metal transporter [Clostridia bacterium]|nr:ZIP family metal transporter [Clostridia bacterium]